MKKKHLTSFFLGIGAIVLLNILAGAYFFRVDLTEEQRYSISPPTKKILRGLDDEIYIKIYLEGDFPPGFKRLQKAIRETLDEFKVYAGKKIRYRFIDPSVAKDSKERAKFYKELVDKGINPTNIFANENGKRVEKLIFPGAMMYYKDYELPVSLFKVTDQRIQGAPSPDQILNQSVENAEYNLISGIRQLTADNRLRIGFIEGHGELEDPEKDDIVRSLQQYYDVYLVNLPQSEIIDTSLKAIIVAKPDSAFTDEDKDKMDQYIMQGGKALFFIDAVGVYMDSVLRDKGSFTFPYEHNLTDMLFKYGVRLNSVLIQDLNSGVIPMVVGNMGDQPQIKPMYWPYHPLANSFTRHPIVKNLGAIQFKFVTTIDTVKADGIHKTPLVFTSKYSRIRATPTFITFNEARQQPDPKGFDKGPYPVAYLLEGKFNSIFKSRSQSRYKGFIKQSKPTKILVCSDGDLLRNDISRKTGKPAPLGMDFVMQTTFSNKDFALNAVDFMIDEQGTIMAKNKEVMLRPLDKLKLQEERTYWQILNMVFPVFLVVLFGFVFNFIRRRNFSGGQVEE